MSASADHREVVVMICGALAVASASAWTAWTIAGLAKRFRRKFDQRVGVQLGRAHLFIDTGRLLVASVALCLAATALVGYVTRSATWTTVVALAGGFIPSLALRHLRRRRVATFRRQLPDLILLTAGALKSGSGLVQALGRVAAELQAPARQELDLMLREQRLGASFDDVLSRLERRMPLDEVHLLAAAFRISHLTGGNLAETLERLADSVRVAIATEEKLAALTAQGRLQARVMGLMPVLVAAALFRIDPIAMQPLFETPFGWAIVVFVATMLTLGMWSIRRIMAIEI